MDVHRFKDSASKANSHTSFLAQLLCEIAVLKQWEGFREKAVFDNLKQQYNFPFL